MSVFATVRLALSFLTPAERTKYSLLVGARALSGLLDVFGIALIAFIASIAATRLDPSASLAPRTFAGVAIPAFDEANLLSLVLFVLLVFLLKAIVAIVLVRAQAHFVAGVETRNSKKVAAFLLMGSLSDATRLSKADFQFAMTGSTTFAFTGLLNNIATIVTESFLLLVITSTFFIVNPFAALFTLVYFAIIVITIQVLIGRSLKRAGAEAVAGTIQTLGLLGDTLDTFREISVLQKQQFFIDRIGVARQRIASSGATLTFLGGMPRYVVETSLILGVVVLVSQQFITGQLATGLVTVGVFLAGGVRMMASLLPLQGGVSNLKQNAEQASLALGLLSKLRAADAPLPENASAPVSLTGETTGLGLDLAGVCFRYEGGDADIIHEVTLSVEPGSYVALIGPSGAGKTTIVDLILGLIQPQAGDVRIASMHPATLRKSFPGMIAYVPQRPGLVSGSIADNIALGVEEPDIDHARLNDVIDAAYLREFIERLPNGVYTSVGQQASAFSGGQIQRIGLARALYTNPRLLVLDEATSGLDAGSESFIASTLKKLHGTVTVIVIAHRLSTVQHADLVHVIEGGRITASGDFQSVREHVPMIAENVKLMSFDDRTAPKSS